MLHVTLPSLENNNAKSTLLVDIMFMYISFQSVLMWTDTQDDKSAHFSRLSDSRNLSLCPLNPKERAWAWGGISTKRVWEEEEGLTFTLQFAHSNKTTSYPCHCHPLLYSTPKGICIRKEFKESSNKIRKVQVSSKDNVQKKIEELNPRLLDFST